MRLPRAFLAAALSATLVSSPFAQGVPYFRNVAPGASNSQGENPSTPTPSVAVGGPYTSAYGAQVSIQPSATGLPGSVEWSVSPGLRAGLGLNPSSGAVTGSSTVPGTTTHTLTASNGTVSASATFTLTVQESPTAPPSLSGYQSAYAFQMLAPNAIPAPSVSGGAAPYSFEALPAGQPFTISATTGEITWTPTAEANLQNVTVRVVDANGVPATSSPFTIVVTDPSPMAFSYPSSVANTVDGVQGTIQAPSASGGASPYTYEATLNPGGALSLLPDGRFAYTLPAGQHGPFRVTASDSAGRHVDRTFSISVADPVQVPAYQPTYQAVANVSGSVPGRTPTGGYPNYVHELVSPVTGVSINGSTGEVSYAVAAGTHQVQVRVRDAFGNAAPISTFSIVATQALGLSYTLDNPLRVTVDARYAANRVGGAGPYSFALKSGSLPPGLTLDLTTGDIAGQPTATGSGNFTIEVTDASDNKKAEAAVSWSTSTINDAAVWLRVTGVTGSSGTSQSTNKARLSDGDYNTYNYTTPQGGGRFSSASTYVGLSSVITFDSDVTLNGMVLRGRWGFYTAGQTNGALRLNLRNASGATIHTVDVPVSGVSGGAQTYAFINATWPATAIRSIQLVATTASTDFTFSEFNWLIP